MRRYAILAAVLTPPATAGEGVDHYAAETPETLAAAMASFAERNGKVRAVLARGELSVADMEEIHEHTCAIEAALAKIGGSLDDLSATLERLHLASEAHDADAVRAISAAYFETADGLAE